MVEIKVNAEQWDQLNDEQKKQIDAIFRESNLLQSEYRIVGDADTPAFDPTAPVQLMSEEHKSDTCTAICEIVASAARAACMKLPWPGYIVCLAAVEVALEECKDACD